MSGLHEHSLRCTTQKFYDNRPRRATPFHISILPFPTLSDSYWIHQGGALIQVLNRDETVQGFFITFEGIEGSGKSTQIKLLGNKLTESGYDVVITREPGDGEMGGRIRELLLSVSSSLDALTELFLLAADRTRHVIEIISPALQKGAIVISDRYADSSLAYQGFGRGLPLEFIKAINHSAVNGLIPNLTIVLDIDPKISLERSRLRLRQQNMFEAEGRFEQENMEFHQRVREGYLKIAESLPDRFTVVDASPDSLVLNNQISHIVFRSLNKWNKTND